MKKIPSDEKAVILILSAVFHAARLVSGDRSPGRSSMDPKVTIEETEKFVAAAKEKGLWPENISL